jgi:uncharacterized protein
MDRSALTRMREFAVMERSELDRLLDETLIAHVGLRNGAGDVMVVPTALARDGDSVLVHGSTGSGWMRRAATGQAVCVTVTALDGIIVARSAFESSFRYRSAVLFGAFTPVPESGKRSALRTITERILPGRSAEVREQLAREIAATLVLRMPISEWSIKVSDGWPTDNDDDVAGPAWAGVIPFGRPPREPPLPAPDLRPGIPCPPSVTGMADPDRSDLA